MADRSDADQTPEQVAGASTSARLVELLAAVAVIALGVVILWQTGEVRDTPTARISARLFPRIVAVGILIVGVWYVLDILRGGGAAPPADVEDVDPTLPTDWRTVGMVGVALIVYLLLIESAGLVIASAALFVVAAFGMGSRRYVRDIAIGILLAAVVYYAFTEYLNVRLPAGLLEGVL